MKQWEQQMATKKYWRFSRNTYLNCIWSPPTERRENLLALIKVRDKQHRLEPSVSAMEAMCETSLTSLASAPNSQPAPCLLLQGWAGCQPCCSIVLSKMMVLWCKWRSTENHCTDVVRDHLHRFFPPLRPRVSLMENLFIFTVCSWGLSQGSLQRPPVWSRMA